MSSEYIPPGARGNELYILPPLEVILEHFRRSGGDWQEYLRRYIEDRSQRLEVEMRIRAMLKDSDKQRKEYKRILDLKIEGLIERKQEALSLDKRKLHSQLEDELMEANSERDKPVTSLDVINGI